MKRKGFTLVEMIVALSIFAMLLGGIFHVLGVELNLWEKIVSAAEKQQIANMVLTRIARDARSAKEVLPSSSSQKLLLKIGDDSLEYSLVNGKARRKKNNYSSYLTAENDLHFLSFSYPAYKIVEIEIEDLTTRVYLRN
jgi:prepilin-type N-terminal cleavage/methylation domain-containing protein